MEPPAETPLRAAFVGAPGAPQGYFVLLTRLEPIRRAAFRLPLKKYTQPKDLILAAKVWAASLAQITGCSSPP